MIYVSLEANEGQYILPEDGDCGLCSELQRFDLGDGGLEHTGLLVVPNHPFIEIQATILQLLMLLLGLAGVVVGSQLGDQVRGVLRCVYRQGLWNDQQGLGKVSNGKLFSEK